MKVSSMRLKLRKGTLLAVPAIIVASLVLVGWQDKVVPAATGPCATPASGVGTLTNTVTVQSAGTYRIWTRMAAANATDNVYSLDIDKANCFSIGGTGVPAYASNATTHFTNSSSNWIGKAAGGNFIDLNLSAGTHTFTFIGTSPGVVIDRMVLTQDLNCVPTGTGDNCASPPDITPPVVVITAPTSNAVLTGQTTVKANATDAVQMGKVEFYVDGLLKSTDTTRDANGDYSFVLNPNDYSIGNHSLQAKAFDSSNNSVMSSTITFRVPDQVAPNVTINSPSANATVTGTISMSAQASDNIGVSKVEFLVDGALKGQGTLSGGNYTMSFDTKSVSNGVRRLTAKAYDAANNVKTSSEVAVTVSNATTPPADTTAPTISLTAPSAGAVLKDSVAISATASDSSGIKQVQFYVDNTLKHTDTQAPFTFSLDTKTLSNGSHTFRAVATDSSSNQNTASSATVTATVTNVSFNAADINEDGAVNILDFGLLKSKFNQTGSGLGKADINKDNVVDIRDFSVMRNEFGK